MKPKITVLMCVYNGGEYLESAIESILQQSFRDFEFLIVDDASTDSSLDVVKKYSKKDKRINIVEMPSNMGLGFCLNAGVQSAQGNWIARMDCDDIALPSRLEKQYEYVKDNGSVDIIGSQALDIDSNGVVQKLRQVPITHDEIVNLVWTNPFIHSTVFMNKERLLEVGSYSINARKRQDYELWFRCVKNRLKFANIEEPLLHYRFSEQTLKRNNPKVMFAQACIGWKGCNLIDAPVLNYFGVCVPFLKSLFPVKVQKIIGKLLLRFDPRVKQK